VYHWLSHSFFQRTLYIFSSFLYHPIPDCSVHVALTCCLFPEFKLMPALALFQLLSLPFGTHSLNMLSHQIA
jgi:hypothetical protein